MSFDQSTITSINPPVWHGGDLLVSWTSTSPVGSVFQVYVNRSLQWSGVGLKCSIPFPEEQVRLDIGVVDAADANTDYSDDLAVLPMDRVELTWDGGTFEGSDLAGFYVYGTDAPGDAIDYSTPVGNIPAYIGGTITDGYGMGGFGLGGFGQASAFYSWTSNVLTISGIWTYAVVPYDSAGNQGAAATVSQTITCPPIEVSPFVDGTRLHYSYNSGSQIITLTWNASPSA